MGEATYNVEILNGPNPDALADDENEVGFVSSAPIIGVIGAAGFLCVAIVDGEAARRLT